MSISTKTKYQAVVKTFGVPVDPEDVNYIDFMYARRDLATVREHGHRKLRYVVELDDSEHLITTTLARIHKRDGEKICREAATFGMAGIAVKARVAAHIVSNYWDVPLDCLDLDARAFRLLVEAVCNAAGVSLPCPSDWAPVRSPLDAFGRMATICNPDA